MSSDCSPADMEGFEARLLSRFRWGMSVKLEDPDMNLRRNVLVQRAEQDGLELGSDIQHLCLRVALLYAYAYSLYKMRLSDAGRPEYEQGVKSLDARIVGYRLSDSAGHLVTQATAVIFKVVPRIKLGVYVSYRLGCKRIGCLSLHSGSRGPLSPSRYGRV